MGRIGPVLCAAMDLNSGLALAAEAAADAHGHAAGSELVLLDGLKARSKRGWGTRDVTRVPLPHRAKAVHINCSADLVAVHCGQRVMLFRVQRPEGGGHPKRNPCKLLLLSQHHLNGAPFPRLCLLDTAASPMPQRNPVWAVRGAKLYATEPTYPSDAGLPAKPLATTMYVVWGCDGRCVAGGLPLQPVTAERAAGV
jgi:hypothetical protein